MYNITIKLLGLPVPEPVIATFLESAGIDVEGDLQTILDMLKTVIPTDWKWDHEVYPKPPVSRSTPRDMVIHIYNHTLPLAPNVEKSKFKLHYPVYVLSNRGNELDKDGNYVIRDWTMETDPKLCAICHVLQSVKSSSYRISSIDNREDYEPGCYIDPSPVLQWAIILKL
jgi:hypothetical protein